MDERERQAREIQRKIGDVLLNDWDPVNIKDDSDWPRDEYDMYVGGVYGLLLRKASPDEVASHLAGIERERMGQEISADKLLPVARKLCGLEVRLDV